MSTPTPGAAPQMAAEHTPIPWESFDKAGANMQSYSQSAGVIGTGENARKIICGCFMDIGGEKIAAANARHIVHCVNTHADLLAALEANMNWLGAPPTGPHEYDSVREAAWELGRAALAKAKAGAQ